MSGTHFASSASAQRLQRPADVVGFLKPGLVPVAGALWLWNILLLVR